MKRKDIDWTSWLVVSIFAIAFSALLARMIVEAHRDVQDSSPAAKTRFQVDFPGLEAAGTLGPFKRRGIVSMANGRFCPCGCGYTIAACLKEDSRCPMRSRNLAAIEEAIRRAKAEKE